MSVILRTFLAILVLLPPGTFRRLDVLTRMNPAQDLTASQQFAERAHKLSDLQRKSSPIRNRNLPERVRKWTDTTFLASSEVLRLNDGFIEALPCDLISPELNDSPRNCAQLAEPAPVLNAHAGARGLLLAMGTLLI